MTDFLATEAGQALKEECLAIKVERETNARDEIIACWHGIGERIVTDPDYKKWGRDSARVLQGIAEYLSVSERTLYYAVAFYQMFPDLQVLMLGEGKHTTWSGIIQKYLTDGGKDEHPLTLGRLLNCDLEGYDARLTHDVQAWRAQGKTLLAALESQKARMG